MPLGTILLIVLVILLIGAIPAWPYSAAWGPFPAGILGVILVVVLILVLTGRFSDPAEAASTASRGKKHLAPWWSKDGYALRRA